MYDEFKFLIILNAYNSYLYNKIAKHFDILEVSLLRGTRVKAAENGEHVSPTRETNMEE
jgi:hypothetical protein